MMSDNNVMVVLTNATPGFEDEFNEWYDNVHLAEVVALPGFVAARRYKYTESQLAGFPESPQKYLALYWIEGDPKVALDALANELASGGIAIPEYLDPSATAAANFAPIGSALIANDLVGSRDLNR